MEYTNRLKLPLLVPNQSGKEITHNEAMIIIDNLLQNHVITKNLNIPPEENNFSDMYIVAKNSSEDWINKDEQIAIFDNGWRFLEPINGMMFYVLDEECFYVYKNEWVKLDNLVNFTELKNTNFNNLQEEDIVKYDGINFVNTKEINLLKLYINNRLLIDENLNISIKNNDNLSNIISITDSNIDFKNNVQISGVDIDNYIVNTINTNEKGFAKADLSNLTEDGQNSIKEVVSQNTALKTLENIEINNLGQQKVFYSLVPDYESRINYNFDPKGESFTIEEDGFFSVYSSINNMQCLVKVNNEQIFYFTGILDFQTQPYPIKKGDILYIVGSSNDWHNWDFYPLKQKEI